MSNIAETKHVAWYCFFVLLLLLFFRTYWTNELCQAKDWWVVEILSRIQTVPPSNKSEDRSFLFFWLSLWLLFEKNTRENEIVGLFFSSSSMNEKNWCSIDRSIYHMSKKEECIKKRKETKKRHSLCVIEFFSSSFVTSRCQKKRRFILIWHTQIILEISSRTISMNSSVNFLFHTNTFILSAIDKANFYFLVLFSLSLFRFSVFFCDMPHVTSPSTNQSSSEFWLDVTRLSSAVGNVTAAFFSTLFRLSASSFHHDSKKTKKKKLQAF